jgi:vanillate O-demethylase monooxygenase subunit
MYPFQQEAPYLRQQWYAAAWSDEVGRQLLARTLLDEPVVLYRTEAGSVAALHGICPHRMLPLSRGTLLGDRVSCAYHGFEFDPEGRCAHIPTQATAPAQFRMRTYPAREQGGLVWLWMGEPDRAAETPLPDIGSAGMDREGWTDCGQSLVPLKSRWSLLLDNLFDLSHIGWVHARTIGASDVVMVPPTVEEAGGRLLVNRSVRDCPTDPFHRWLHPHASDFVHLDLYSDLLGPGIVNAGSRAIDATSGQLLGNLNFIHIVTPETAHSSHYFGVVTRDFRLDDAALSAAVGAQDNAVREEDRVTLEAIEPWADRFGDPRRELSAQVDAGAIRLRRHLEALLAAEAAT